jgi:hypothetical protein
VVGSGLAIVPFLYGGVVQEYSWLNDKQFRDAVAVAMLTPGPIVSRWRSSATSWRAFSPASPCRGLSRGDTLMT